jgi:hypothetical protein
MIRVAFRFIDAEADFIMHPPYIYSSWDSTRKNTVSVKRTKPMAFKPKKMVSMDVMTVETKTSKQNLHRIVPFNEITRLTRMFSMLQTNVNGKASFVQKMKYSMIRKSDSRQQSKIVIGQVY